MKAKTKAKTITMKDLVEECAYLTGQTRVRTRTMIDLLLETITLELVKGNRVMVKNFGILEVRERGAATKQNPRTKEVIQVPARNRVRFQVGKELKERVLNS